MEMKITKEQRERALYVWEGIKTGTAKSQHYKVEMIKLYNEMNSTRYKYGTSCSSCLNTCYLFVKGIVETKPKTKAKPKAKKKNVKK